MSSLKKELVELKEHYEQNVQQCYSLNHEIDQLEMDLAKATHGLHEKENAMTMLTNTFIEKETQRKKVEDTYRSLKNCMLDVKQHQESLLNASKEEGNQQRELMNKHRDTMQSQLEKLRYTIHFDKDIATWINEAEEELNKMDIDQSEQELIQNKQKHIAHLDQQITNKNDMIETLKKQLKKQHHAMNKTLNDAIQQHQEKKKHYLNSKKMVEQLKGTQCTQCRCRIGIPTVSLSLEDPSALMVDDNE